MDTPFDIEAFCQHVGGDRSVVRLLLSLFVETADSVFLSLEVPLEEMAESAYTRKWQQQLHLLRGSALNIGAETLCTRAERAELEAASLSGAEKREALDQLQQDYAALKAYILSQDMA